MNLYAYVHNAPLTHWDAYGLLDEKGVGWDKMRSWGQASWQQASQEYSQFVVGFNKRFANDQFNTARFVNNWTVKPLTGSLGYEGRFSGASFEGWLSKHQESLNSRFFSHADPHSVANKVGDFLAGGASDILLFGAAAKGVIWGWQAVGKLASGITAIRSTILSPVQKLSGGTLNSLGGLAKIPMQAPKMTTGLSSLDRKGISLAGSRRAPLDYAPFQTARNEVAVINNRTYVGHALDRMQDRGFMPSVVENAIKTGRSSLTKIPGRVEYYDSANNLRVILQDNERVISIIPKRGIK